MRSIKHAALALFALAAASCSQSGTGTVTTVSLQEVQNQIAAACNYVPTIESIAAVATTITSAVNAAAGAAATIGVTVGNAIVTDVCKAVQAAQTTTPTTQSAAKPGEAHPLTVVVNGKQVTGQYTPGGKS